MVTFIKEFQLQMSFIPKLFYNDAPESGGGTITDTQASQQNNENNSGEQQNQSVEKQDLPRPILTEDEIKDYGFDSPEALKDFLVKQKEANVPEEVKKERENIAKTNLLKYAGENKLFTVDEYSQYENLRAKSDQDLVYESYLKDYKEDHPEITDADELEEAAKEDFEFEYKLKDGVSEATKKRGLAKLARDAKELRSPVESKITTAISRFNETTSQEKLIKESYPKFEKFLKDSIAKNTPDKLIAYKYKNGEEEVDIDIPLTQKERDDMLKEFSTPKTFQKFLDKKPEEIQEIIDKKMQGWVFLNKKDEIIAKGIEVGKGFGTKEGSNVGAEHPFAIKQNSVIENTSSETLEESNKRMAQQREKLKLTR